jgi:hypothetical protein
VSDRWRWAALGSLLVAWLSAGCGGSSAGAGDPGGPADVAGGEVGGPDAGRPDVPEPPPDAKLPSADVAADVPADVPADAPAPPRDAVLPPADAPAPPVDVVFPPEDAPAPPVDVGFPPEDAPAPPVDVVTPPADVPAPPVDVVLPPADVPAPPLDVPTPPVDVPAPPLDVPTPPADVPAAPLDVPTPPADVPAAPLDVPTPPADVPAPPLDVPTPPADVPAPPLDVPTPPADVPPPPADVPTPPADVPPPPADVPAPPPDVPEAPADVSPASDVPAAPADVPEPPLDSWQPVDVPADVPPDVPPPPECVSDDDCRWLGFAVGPCHLAICLRGSCVAAPLAEGERCDDGDPCTATSTCTAGICSGPRTVGCDPTEGPESDVVIHEVHFDPDFKPLRTEFIELTNRGEAPVDLSGWRLEDAVDLTFPAGTVLEPGGFLVAAEDPADLWRVYGVPAVGPWTGKLDNDGERIELTDADGERADVVRYRVGFPWPVAAAGEGSSMELLDPALDNSLGGHWRASAPDPAQPAAAVTLVAAGSGGWSYRKGTEAPEGDWSAPEFIESAPWVAGATAPVGYGGNDDATVLSDMPNRYTSVYVRKAFDLESALLPGGALTAGLPGRLTLSVYVGDGAVVWLNGIEVARLFVPPGPLDWYATSLRLDRKASWYDVKIPGARQLLRPGRNVLAIHALNATIGSGDLSIDARLVAPARAAAGGAPTPGAPNSTATANAPPAPRQVRATPAQPASGEEVLVSVKLTDPDGVAGALLSYQVVAPGAYVPSVLALPVATLQAAPTTPRAPNPAFEDPASWTHVPLHDDGLDGDAVAGDDVWTVRLPGQANRTLVRYRILVMDQRAELVRVPYPDDRSLNFAYWVYDGVPAYETHAAETMRSLPVYTFLARAADWSDMIAWESTKQLPQFITVNGVSVGNPARYVENWPGTLIVGGAVYDHVDLRLRGANGRYYLTGKRSLRVNFHRGSYLQAYDAFGRPYPNRWATLLTGKGFDNRRTLTQDLNQALGFTLFPKVGVPAPETHFAHLRVVDAAAEAPDRWRGDFWGLMSVIEPYDGRFLDARGLPPGNLYKLNNPFWSGLEQRDYQAQGAVTDGSDHDDAEANLTGYSSEAEIRARVALDAWYAYHALCEAMRHYDFWPSANKNAAYWFEPDYRPENQWFGKLWTFPYDLDASWGPTWNNGHDLVYNLLYACSDTGCDAGSHPELHPERMNVVREVRDLLWQPDQIGGLIGWYGDLLRPFLAADRDRWYNAPADAGNWSGLSGPALTSFDALLVDLNNFAFVGGSWPGGTVGAGGRAAHLDTLQAAGGEGALLPATPTLTYTGADGFPANALAFTAGPFADPQGAETFGGMAWRLGELADPAAPGFDPTRPPPMEIDAVWASGPLTAFVETVTIPASAVRVGHRYRARVRMRDDTGRWSHWSAPVELVAGAADDVLAAVDGLRVTEVMYHPPDSPPGAAYDGADAEYVEIANVGAEPVGLNGVRLTGGVSFDFSTGSSGVAALEPGERVVVVRSRAAFEARYGAGAARIAGEYSGRLDNAGEDLTLALGGDLVIESFTYDDGGDWPDRADGWGSSLERVDPSAPANEPAVWRASTLLLGSPGAEDLAPLTDVGVNEVLARPAVGQVPGVELRSTAAEPRDLGGWTLAVDDALVPELTLPAGATLDPGGWLLLGADGLGGPLDLDGAAGGRLFLLAPTARGWAFADDAPFGPQALGEAWARAWDGAGPLQPAVEPTLGGPNGAPRVGPVVVSELVYHPAPFSDAERAAAGGASVEDLEYLEVWNPTAQPVDLTGWRLGGGVSFVLPAGLVVPAGGCVVLVPFDPWVGADAAVATLFRQRYAVPTGAVLLGGYGGRLANGGESVALLTPDPLLGALGVLLQQDRVDYDDEPPWPVAADGGGAALHRVARDAAGLTAEGFTAGPPSPGVCPPR